MLRHNKEMILASCFCCVVVVDEVVVVRGGIMFAWLFSFGFVKRRFLSCFFYGEVFPFVLHFSIFNLCRAGLVER